MKSEQDERVGLRHLYIVPGTPRVSRQSLTSLSSHPDSPNSSRTLFSARPYAVKMQLMGKSGLIGESPPVFSE